MNSKDDAGNEGLFDLVESRADADNGRKLKRELAEDEQIQTDSIGASEEDCQVWALRRQEHDGSLLGNLIGIVDSRTVSDGTILVQDFQPNDDVTMPFGKYGRLPPKPGHWVSFRIEHSKAFDLASAVKMVSPDITWPVYYGNKERLTDDQGVFDVDEAERLIRVHDPEVYDYDIEGRDDEIFEMDRRERESASASKLSEQVKSIGIDE